MKVTSDGLAIGLVFIVLAALACFAPAQSDTWWTLKAGQEIWQTGKIPFYDTYSHTAAGLFWPNHEWLTEAVFFAVHRVGGMPLLAGLLASCMVGAWGLAWRRSTGSFELRLSLLVACVAGAASAFAMRAQVFSMLLFAVTCALLERKRLLWLPFLFVVWTNLHGGVMLGVAAVGATLVAAMIVERRVPWLLAFVTIACILATAASPLGFGLWRFIPLSMKFSRVNQLEEWTAPDLSAQHWPFWGFAAALVVSAILQRHRLETRKIQLLFIALAVLPLAIRSVRNVHIFLLAGLPALSALWTTSDPRTRRDPREHPRVNAIMLAGAAFLAALIVALVWIRPPAQLAWRPITPPAIKAVSDCADPMYNTYVGGGVLIWFVPGKRVFIDNRQDPYPLEFLQASRQLEFTGDYEPLFRQYAIRCAVVPPESLIAQRLRADPRWGLRYADEGWSVFEPKTSHAASSNQNVKEPMVARVKSDD